MKKINIDYFMEKVMKAREELKPVTFLRTKFRSRKFDFTFTKEENGKISTLMVTSPLNSDSTTTKKFNYGTDEDMLMISLEHKIGNACNTMLIDNETFTIRLQKDEKLKNKAKEIITTVLESKSEHINV